MIKKIIIYTSIILVSLCIIYIGIPFYTAKIVLDRYEKNPAATLIVFSKMYKDAVFKHNGWIYFGDQDTSIKCTAIYKIKPDGTGKEVISKDLLKPDRYTYRMTNDGKWIYYILARDKGKKIYSLWKITLDGKENQLINDKVKFRFIEFKDNKIYASTENSDIYMLDSNGKIIKKLVSNTERIRRFEVHKGYIYYSTSDENNHYRDLYRISPDEDKTTKILEHVLSYGIIKDNIYYTKGERNTFSGIAEPSESFKTDLDGTNTHKVNKYKEHVLFGNSVMAANIDNWVYSSVIDQHTVFAPHFKVNVDIPIPIPVLPNDKIYKY